jgi:hypothetical protein
MVWKTKTTLFSGAFTHNTSPVRPPSPPPQNLKKDEEAVCITISVKTLIGKTLTLNVNPTDSILTILGMIQDEVKLLIKDQQLLLWKDEAAYEEDVRNFLESRIIPVDMKVLEENNSVDHYGIDNNSIILLTLKLRGEDCRGDDKEDDGAECDGGDDNRDEDKDELLKTQFELFEQQRMDDMTTFQMDTPELGDESWINIASVWKRGGNRVTVRGQSQRGVTYLVWLDLPAKYYRLLSQRAAEMLSTAFNLTKIGQASSWKLFLAKLINFRTFINFTQLRFIACLHDHFDAEDVEQALHTVFHLFHYRGEWFNIGQLGRFIADDIFRSANLGNVTIVYGSTIGKPELRLTMPSNADTPYENGRVYNLRYGFHNNHLAVLNALMIDDGAVDTNLPYNNSVQMNIGCLCELLLWSFKIGCVENNLDKRMGKFLYACGFSEFAQVYSYQNRTPYREEKELHIALQSWWVWSEWFLLLHGDEKDGNKKIMYEKRHRNESMSTCRSINTLNRWVELGIMKNSMLKKIMSGCMPGANVRGSTMMEENYGSSDESSSED